MAKLPPWMYSSCIYPALAVLVVLLAAILFTRRQSTPSTLTRFVGARLLFKTRSAVPIRAAKRRLRIVQGARHWFRLRPRRLLQASPTRRILYVRGCHAHAWTVVTGDSDTVGDVLRRIQRLYGVPSSNAELYLSSQWLPLKRDMSVASLNLDSLSIISWRARLRGGSSRSSSEPPEASASTSSSKPPNQKKRKTDSGAASQNAKKPKTGLDAEKDVDVWGYTNAEILAHERKKWKAACYAHYDVSVERNEEEKHIIFVFTCKYRPEEHIVKRRRHKEDGGTSNLNRGIPACDAIRGTAPTQPTLHQTISTYTRYRHRAILVMQAATAPRPFTAPADRWRRAELDMMRPQTALPDRTTTSKDTVLIYNSIKGRVKNYFAKHVGSLHVVLDGWTAPNVASYLGIVLIWFASGSIKRAILDFVLLHSAHTGEYLAECLANVLNEYGIAHLLHTICADNATNNDKMYRALVTHIPHFRGADSRLRCFPHTINLMAKVFISFFFAEPKKRKVQTAIQTSRRMGAPTELEPETYETEVIDDPDGIYTDGDGGDDVDEAKREHDRQVVRSVRGIAFEKAHRDFGIKTTEEERKTALAIFPKVAGLARRVHDTTVLADALRKEVKADEELAKKGNQKTSLDRRVPTRWNSDLACLDAHVLLKNPVLKLTSNGAYNLSSYKLTAAQWSLCEQLSAVLRMFDSPTKLFSQTEVPLVHQVVPMIEKMEGMLTKARDKTSFPPMIRVAAVGALEVVGKYYGRYRVMTPTRKMEWFKKNEWRVEDIEAVRRLVTDRWNSKYRGTESAPTTTRQVQQKSEWDVDFASDDETGGSNGPSDTIEWYLSQSLVSQSTLKEAGGLLPWWERERKHRPRVAQMALDFLSAPASSVDAERAFSNGRLKLNHLQHNKSPETFRAQMCLSSWDDGPFFPNLAELAKIVEDKAKGSKAKAAAEDSQQGPDVVDLSKD